MSLPVMHGINRFDPMIFTRVTSCMIFTRVTSKFVTSHVCRDFHQLQNKWNDIESPAIFIFAESEDWLYSYTMTGKEIEFDSISLETVTATNET